MEVEVSEEALGAGAAALSAALTEAMKEGHAKSVQLQQQKLTCVLRVSSDGPTDRSMYIILTHHLKTLPFQTRTGRSTRSWGWARRWRT